MPTHLKRVLNQARLQTETFDMMVQHLEREIELNGLLAPNETKSMYKKYNKPQTLPNRQAHAMAAEIPATLSKTAERQPAKPAIEASEHPTKLLTHVRHVVRRATQRKTAIQVPIGRMDHSGGKHPGLRPQTVSR